MALDVKTPKNYRKGWSQPVGMAPQELRNLAAHFGKYVRHAIDCGDADTAGLWARGAAHIAQEALAAEASR